MSTSSTAYCRYHVVLVLLAGTALRAPFSAASKNLLLRVIVKKCGSEGPKSDVRCAPSVATSGSVPKRELRVRVARLTYTDGNAVPVWLSCNTTMLVRQ
eukprot:6190767-Pleurochrysis_carterae.AAC.4